MLVVLLIIAVLFFLGALFYKQSIQEYRINQIEWEQRHQLDALFEERVPVVVRSMPASPVWTHDDVIAREFYGKERPHGSAESLREIIMSGQYSGAIWDRSYRARIFDAAGAAIWFDKIWTPVLTGTRGWLAGLLPPAGECFIGGQGLMEFKANWTLIVPSEGAIIVSVLNQKEKKLLPTAWSGLDPKKITKEQTPYAGSIQYMDVIVRPGTGLWVPAHWLVSWEAKDEGSVPLVMTVAIHNPVSWLVMGRDKNIN